MFSFKSGTDNVELLKWYLIVGHHLWHEISQLTKLKIQFPAVGLVIRKEIQKRADCLYTHLDIFLQITNKTIRPENP